MRVEDCLSNLIGIDHKCETDTPDSGLFVNRHLTGMTLKLAADAQNQEDLSPESLIEEKIEMAGQKMVDDIRELMEPKMAAKSIVDLDTIGRYEEDLPLIASESGKYWGIKVRIKGHEYYELNLSGLRLKLDAAITTNIFVWDLMTGKLLDTIPITTVADTPTDVVINKRYIVDKQRLSLFVGIDSSVAGVYDASIHHSINCSSCRGNRNINSYSHRNHIHFQSVSIGQTDTLIDKNLKGISHTGGLSLDYSLECSVEPLVCNMARTLARALLYQTGVQILDELIYSSLNSRLTSIVLIHGQKVDKLKESYDKEYEASMGQIFNNLAINDGECFHCRQVVSYRTTLP